MQDAVGKVVIIVAVTLICLRIILPVWHRADGYVVRLYPFWESAVCTARDSECNIDRSRTAFESGSVALAALGILYMRRKRRNGTHRENSF